MTYGPTLFRAKANTPPISDFKLGFVLSLIHRGCLLRIQLPEHCLTLLSPKPTTFSRPESK